MTISQALILAFVQGLTEFLPVSSSGHLVIIQNLFGFTTPPVFYDLMLHGSSLLAITVFFRKDIWKLIINWRGNINFIVGLAIASIPAGIVGVLLSNQLELIFSSTKLVGIALLVTGAILVLTRWVKSKESFGQPTTRQSILIGLFQAIAVLPGISRSGSTISAGLFSGLSPSSAFRYSFFLAIPAILGAVVLGIRNTDLGSVDWGMTILGFSIALIVGYLALVYLSNVLQKRKLYYFSFYCFALGLISLLFLS